MSYFRNAVTDNILKDVSNYKVCSSASFTKGYYATNDNEQTTLNAKISSTIMSLCGKTKHHILLKF